MTSKRRSHLTELIWKHPGLNFRDLMRITGMKNGVLSHHLNSLEKSSAISAIRGPRQSRFYPSNFSEIESKIVKALRRQTPKSIIEFLILYEPSGFRDIVKYSGKSPSTVSLYLSQLVRDGIVKTKLVERTKMYYLGNRDVVDRLVEDYRPGMLDGPASGLEDIVNSL